MSLSIALPVLLAFAFGLAVGRFIGRDRRDSGAGQSRPRIEADLLKVLGEPSDEFRVLCAQDGTAFDWGMVRFRYRRMIVEMWRDRGTVDVKLTPAEPDPAVDLYDLVQALDGGPEEGHDAMTLTEATRCIAAREGEFARFLSQEGARRKVEAAAEATRVARLKAFGVTAPDALG